MKRLPVGSLIFLSKMNLIGLVLENKFLDFAFDKDDCAELYWIHLDGNPGLTFQLFPWVSFDKEDYKVQTLFNSAQTRKNK